MATTTYGANGVSTSTAGWMIGEALSHAKYFECLQRFCKPLVLPKNQTKQVNLRRPNLFAVSTTPLTEGVAPTGEAFSYTTVDISISQYGRYVEITDVVMDVAKEPVLQEATQLLGEAFGQTFETITYNAARGGTSVFYANGAARNAVNTQISAALLRNATRLLRRNKAKFITDMVSGSPNFKTEPVGAAYFAFGHTDIEADLRSILGDAFVPVERYGSQQKAVEFEVGKFENIRFILTPEHAPWPDAGGAKGTMKSTGGTSADVYPLIIMGKEAMATVALRGVNAMSPKVVRPEVAAPGNPLGQKGTVGFKSYFAAAIVNDAWMTRIELAVSA